MRSAAQGHLEDLAEHTVGQTGVLLKRTFVEIIEISTLVPRHQALR